MTGLVNVFCGLIAKQLHGVRALWSLTIGAGCPKPAFKSTSPLASPKSVPRLWLRNRPCLSPVSLTLEIACPP